MKWLKEYTFRNHIDDPVNNKILVIEDDDLPRDHQWTMLATLNATSGPDGSLSIQWDNIVIPRVVELSELPLFLSWPYKTNAFDKLLKGEICL